MSAWERVALKSPMTHQGRLVEEVSMMVVQRSFLREELVEPYTPVMMVFKPEEEFRRSIERC